MDTRPSLAPLAAFLLLPGLAVARDDAPAREAAPIPDGRFRVVVVETNSGPDAVTIEALIRAPSRSGLLVRIHHANGSSLRSRGMFGSDPREKEEEIRLTAAVERMGNDRQFARNYAMFSISTASSSGGGSGGGSINLPPNQPLDELLITTLEAGDYPIGEDVAAFRFGDDRYTIRVEPARPPKPLFIPIPIPMVQVFQPAGTFAHPGIPIGWIIPTPKEELMRLIEQRVEDGTPIPPKEIPFGFDLEGEDEPGR